MQANYNPREVTRKKKPTKYSIKNNKWNKVIRKHDLFYTHCNNREIEKQKGMKYKEQIT